MATKVKNLNGTSERVPNGYNSWLHFWETKARMRAFSCSNEVCNARAEVGAHVKKEGFFDMAHYIVPLCKGCNNKSSVETFNVTGLLVPVNS